MICAFSRVFNYNAAPMSSSSDRTGRIQDTHAKHVLTPWLPQGGLKPPVIVKGEGSYIFDSDGKKYFDMGSGLVAVNLGHGHPKVVAAIQEQAATLCYAA